jgi:hypothetical protein
MTMVPIASYTANGSNTAAFTNIPQTYKHLQIRMSLRGIGTAAVNDFCFIRFNDDFGTNYHSHWFEGYGNGTFSTSNNNNLNFMYLGAASSIRDSNTPNLFATQIIDILDYTSTTKFKTVKMFYGFDRGTEGVVGIAGGTWRNTAAITNIPGVGNANVFQFAGSQIDLYGVVG